MDGLGPSCTSSKESVGLTVLAHTRYQDAGKVTRRIERIRHRLIPIVGNKTRAFLSLIVTIVVLQVVDPPFSECLSVLFLPSQRRSCSISVLITVVEILNVKTVPYCAQVYVPAEEYIPHPSPIP